MGLSHTSTVSTSNRRSYASSVSANLDVLDSEILCFDKSDSRCFAKHGKDNYSKYP